MEDILKWYLMKISLINKKCNDSATATTHLHESVQPNNQEGGYVCEFKSYSHSKMTFKYSSHLDRRQPQSVINPLNT